MSTPQTAVPPQNTPQRTPRIPAPIDADYTTCRNKKRLIILCDGTCDDSLAESVQYPTNVTKISRALSPNAWVLVPREDGKKEYEQVEQIVHYQAGPGTDGTILGAPFGTGLSEIVRSAYGFLCANYNNGDKIYVFGFSRGAYVARSIAGLVAEHGLLSKRGMDNFHVVYDGFYNEYEQRDTGDRIDGEKPTPLQLGLRVLPRGTVEVVGVFDTVGFHNPLTAQLNRIFHKNMSIGGDKNEFANTLLSENVKYAFHALSLDETRIPFQTTLFFQPKILSIGAGGEERDDWKTTLKQMWFSGDHSDIGGGKVDSRLSNIALMWMVSQLVSHKLLEFDQNYLLDISKEEAAHWATSKGRNTARPTDFIGTIVWIMRPIGGVLKTASSWTVKNIFRNTSLSRKISGVRTPGLYIPEEADGDVGDPENFETYEEFHSSLQDRNLKKWPCQPLTFLDLPQVYDHEGDVPTRSKKARSVVVSKFISQLPAGVIEMAYRGRVRDVNKPPFTISAEPLIVPVRETLVPSLIDNPFRSNSSSFQEAANPIK